MKTRSGVVLKSQVLFEQLSRARVRCEPILIARVFVFVLLLCLGSVHGWAQQNNQQPMRGLDEEVQQINTPITLGEW